MADRSVQIDFTVQDNATTQIKNVEKSLSGFANEAKKVQGEMGGLQKIGANLGNTFKGMGQNIGQAMATMGKTIAVGAVAVGGALIKMGADSVKAASEAQVEMARFEATLKTMGEAGMKAKDSILALSQANIQLGFDDEETANSMAYLLQRTNDLSKATDLNGLAMDLARAKNMSLTQATQMLGMVLSGNGRVLKQYGIDIKDSASPMEALADLQQKVGGQGKAFAQTYAGAMAILKVSIGNVKETVGEQLLPVLAELAQKALPLVTKALEAVPVVFNYLKDAIAGAVEQFQKLMASAEVAPIVEQLKKNLEGLWQSVVNLWEALKGLADILNPQLSEALAIVSLGLMNGLVAGFKFLVDAITEGIKWLKDFIVFLEPLKPVFDAINFMVIQLGNSLKELWGSINEVVMALQPGLSEVLKIVGFILTGVLGLAIMGFVALLNGLVIAIKFVIDVVKTIIQWLTKLVEVISFGIIMALQQLRDVWDKTWKALKDAFQPIYDWIMEKVNALVSAISRVADGMRSAASAVGKTLSGGGSVQGKKESGGYIPETGLYLMHKGEWVMKSNAYQMVGVGKAEKDSTGGGINIVITGNSFMGKEDIAEQIGNDIVNVLKKNMRLAY